LSKQSIAGSILKAKKLAKKIQRQRSLNVSKLRHWESRLNHTKIALLLKNNLFLEALIQAGFDLFLKGKFQIKKFA